MAESGMRQFTPSGEGNRSGRAAGICRAPMTWASCSSTRLRAASPVAGSNLGLARKRAAGNAGVGGQAAHGPARVAGHGDSIRTDCPTQSAATALSLLNFCRRYIGLAACFRRRAPDRFPTCCPVRAYIARRPGCTDHLGPEPVGTRTPSAATTAGANTRTRFIAESPFVPTLSGAGWQIDPSRGGLQFDRSGDLDYVRHVLRAHSGLTLPPPPKPAKQVQSGR